MSMAAASLRFLVRRRHRLHLFTPLAIPRGRTTFLSDANEEVPQAKNSLQPKNIVRKQVLNKLSRLTTIAIWDLADDVEYDQVMLQHLFIVLLSTRSLQALYQLTDVHSNLHGKNHHHLLKKKSSPSIDMLPPIGNLPSKMKWTVCVEGF